MTVSGRLRQYNIYNIMDTMKQFRRQDDFAAIG